MPTSIAAAAARLSGRALCAAVALTLSLMCPVLAIAATTAPMTSTTALSGVALPTAMGAAATEVDAAPAVSAVVVKAGSEMSSMCIHACVTQVTGMCTLAAGLGVTTVLALLLVARRDTLIGLLARSRPSAVDLRLRRERTPWTLPSLCSLCVLRV